MPVTDHHPRASPADVWEFPDGALDVRPDHVVQLGKPILEREPILFDERHQATAAERGERGVTVLHPYVI